MLQQDILESIYSQSKKQNIAITLYTIFNDQDPHKTGYVSVPDFAFALEHKLNVVDLNELDVEFLATRYYGDDQTNRLVQYERFFKDYEEMERLGLRAMKADPLRQSVTMAGSRS